MNIIRMASIAERVAAFALMAALSGCSSSSDAADPAGDQSDAWRRRRNVVDSSACTPTTCAAAGAQCGTISDGCGGTLTCGDCTAPDVCGVSLANVCGAATTPTAPAPAPKPTYYVDASAPQASDANPGTEALPWKTITKAAKTMAPGESTLVAAGTYPETVDTVRGGVAGKRITFRASGTVNVTGFLISNAYVTIDGFTIKSGGVENRSGSYCEILNNKLVESSILIAGNYGPAATNCLIKGNVITSTTHWGNDWPAITFFGSNHVVENNEIGPSMDTDAFRPFGHDNVIRNNYVHDITLSPGSEAHMDVFQTFGLNGYESYNQVFENNLIVDPPNQFYHQMCMTENNQNPNVRDFDVRNNVWVNVPTQCNIGIPNFRFYNNTVYNGGKDNGIILWTYNDPPKGVATGAQVLNNIIITAKGITNRSGAIYVKDVGVTVDYNFTTSVDTWAALVDDVPQPHGINGGDPRFVNVAGSDFHLQASSPAVDRGKTIAGFSWDFAGASRPAGAAWDLGAFELGGAK